MGKTRKKTVFLAKKAWEDFLEGREKILTTLNGIELRDLFDDLDDVPEGHYIKVEVSEVPKEDMLSFSF